MQADAVDRLQVTELKNHEEQLEDDDMSKLTRVCVILVCYNGQAMAMRRVIYVTMHEGAGCFLSFPAGQ